MTASRATTLLGLIALLTLAALPALAVKPLKSAMVHLRPMTPGVVDFVPSLQIRLLRKSRIMPRVQISVTDDPRQADFVFELYSRGPRDAKWHEGHFTPARATMKVQVIAKDHCGRVVWTRDHGDVAFFGAQGAQHTARKIAVDFKLAVHNRNSRFNKTRRNFPCIADGTDYESLEEIPFDW